jgi:uncharacterized protein
MDDPRETEPAEDAVIAATLSWVERAVIGLELCPFARQPMRQGRVRLRVSAAEDADTLVAHLEQELQLLHDTPAVQCETTLLIHPRLFAEPAAFLDFNDFLELADAVVEALDLEGVIQVASFHPGYVFADSRADDPANYSNRSPYPILHLLREESLERAVDAHPDTDGIWQRNVDRLRLLGHAGWKRLWVEP